jgi:hypothetical protein
VIESDDWWLVKQSDNHHLEGIVERVCITKGGEEAMELRVWVKDRIDMMLPSPTAARLLVELVHGNSGHGQTHGIPSEVLPAQAMALLDRDAPSDLDRFKIFCLQRTPYGGKVAAHIDRSELETVRSFIRDAADTGFDVVVSFN